MSRIVWRWEERDFGFRFRAGKGKRGAEHYQAKAAGDFYVVPGAQRKLTKARIDALASLMGPPPALRVVPNPWRNYASDWDRIDTDEGLCLNYAAVSTSKRSTAARTRASSGPWSWSRSC